MLHFTFQNMRAFYGPWLRGLGLRTEKNEMYQTEKNGVPNPDFRVSENGLRLKS